MDSSDNESYEEEEVVAERGVLMAAVEIELPNNIPDNPESPSPVTSSPAASLSPAFPVDPLGYNSKKETFGGGDLQIYSTGEVARLQEWAEFVRGVCGQVGFTWVVPPISGGFATFLWPMYGP